MLHVNFHHTKNYPGSFVIIQFNCISNSLNKHPGLGFKIFDSTKAFFFCKGIYYIIQFIYNSEIVQLAKFEYGIFQMNKLNHY